MVRSAIVMTLKKSVRKSIQGGLLALLLVGLWLPISPRAAAAAGARFTVTAKSAFLHAAPSYSGARMYSVFAGQAFGVVGRSADATWLLLDFPGAAPGSAWIA